MSAQIPGHAIRGDGHTAQDEGAPAYLLPEEVAAILRLSTKSVYRIASADPTMPALRLNGRTIRFPRERLERWLRDREQGQGRPHRTRGLVPPGAEVRAVSTIAGSGEAPCATSCATGGGKAAQEQI